MSSIVLLAVSRNLVVMVHMFLSLEVMVLVMVNFQIHWTWQLTRQEISMF